MVKRARVAASIVALTALIGGCSGFGETLHRLARERSASATPTSAVSSDELVANARPSVVKVHGESESCLKVSEGSGFVVAPHKVMTNAHVVAGAEAFMVDTTTETLEAHVISFDPRADIAVLDVPELAARPLKFAEYTAGAGVDTLVLGFPGATAFKASPATIREVTDIEGPDIYRATTITRQVYILIGSFPDAGSSGSAVVDLNGQVLGVYFGAETTDTTTGFAMTAAQVAPQMAKADATQATDTGECVY
ncbi:trypsin-like peptidase domain-containing protein [Mycobacterium sp. ITM-2016-00318]|uniref:trypsin-like peptidase domain-containing protein n=1 Tax=Mycobacterium sp. ITM-2016-00318 TaxID=2099693 RepID=UPI0026C874E6|nr:trypsin-like peptidase domain-containing protein [Mycobacterium sp. ITM-2016-00318]WNG91903.1 trypsin-like peptidase domain-containing protein [Mycobacterium sp. ITM-2016-00318]